VFDEVASSYRDFEVTVGIDTDDALDLFCQHGRAVVLPSDQNGPPQFAQRARGRAEGAID
jgi:predicted RNase H-like nuclease (RuvC/YqgF family)